MAVKGSILAQASLAEFTQEPLLSVAAVLLIVVSIGWIVVARLISRELRRVGQRRGPVGEKDMWDVPPRRRG